MANLPRSSISVNRRYTPELTSPFVAGNLALALLTSPLPQVTRSLDALVAKPQSYADTSQSAFAAQREPVAAETPTVNRVFNAPAPVRNVVDTSQSAFALLRAPVAASAPFSNSFLRAPSSFRYLSDTSLGIAKVLFSDASFSFKNIPHTAPDRVRPVTDTSQNAFLALQPLAPKPFFNSPFSLLDKFHITPPDTTQQTSLARGIPAPAATISVVQPYITVYFWKRTA